MKACLSKLADKILSDPKARKKLRNNLSATTPCIVTTKDGKRYKVKLKE
jgi:uncharacterized protein (UPF0216 family)